MPEISKDHLSRGALLTREHVFDPLSSTQTAIEGGGTLLDTSNLKARGRFGLSVPCACLDSKLFPFSFGVSGRVLTHWCVPFPLIPTQDLWDGDGAVDETSPDVRLDAIALSWDTRAEAAAIADQYMNIGGTGHEGKLDWDRLAAYDIQIAIVEKSMAFFGAEAPWTPEREVWSASLPSFFLQDIVERSNPLVVDNINVKLSWYKTYMVMLHAPLDQGADGGGSYKLAMPSVMCRVDMSAPLVARDSGASNVQNLPTYHTGGKQAGTLGIQVPNAASLITATGKRGVQTNYKLVDDLVADGLEGGYSQDGDVGVFEQIQEDACYFMEIIPMFQNMGDERIMKVGNEDQWPYITGPAYADATFDRRQWPIRYPCVIHHVFAVLNYSGINSDHPGSASLQHRIGLNLWTGPQSDQHTYQEVANATISKTDRTILPGAVIDRIKSKIGGVLSADANEPWDFEIVHIPLVTGPLGAGTGPFSQGVPFYAGRASSKLTARTQVGSGQAVTDLPFTDGAERWMEARWTIDDSFGVHAAGNGTAGEVYVGYGGNFLIVVGKRHLAGIGGEVLV